MHSSIVANEASAPARPAWRAVWSLGLGVFGLIIAEFLPASLLTPMAASLGVSEGVAGQSVTATALVALVTGLLVSLWGFAFGLVPVGWSTWLATTVTDEAESAGGLMVASIQLAISAGAAGGGAVFDLNGASGVFTASGVLLLAAMVMVFAGVKVKPVAAE